MKSAHWLTLVFAGSIACGGVSSAPVALDPSEATSTGKADGTDLVALPTVACAGVPDAGAAGSWRHAIKSRAISFLGDTRHRGIDLITDASASTQTISGEIKYGGLLDKSLEDEQVDLFACKEGAWQFIGSAITDGEGTFSYDLSGDSRLSIGMRGMYVSVTGDRTGASFLAVVAQDGARVAFSDVDGTLTSSENAFPESLVTGATVAANDGAPDALNALGQRNYLIIFLTSRGRVFTQATRDWLATNGFPLGPVRLAGSLITLPGDETTDYKASSVATVIASGLSVEIGIGNRQTDHDAYASQGIAADKIFLKMPEFQSECQSLIDDNEIVPFTSYRDITATLAGE